MMKEKAKVVYRKGQYKVKAEPVVIPAHSVGRPFQGRVKFTRALIESLPETMHVRGMAAKIGITQTTAQQWVHKSKPALPVKRIKHNGRFEVRREALLQWLKTTNRLEEK